MVSAQEQLKMNEASRNALFWSRDRDLVLKVCRECDVAERRRLASVDGHVRRSYARSSPP